MYFGFDHVSISYGKKQILDDVSMEFEKGKITTIIGPNGCGKSSLLKTIPRTVTPISGTAIFEDKPIKSYSPKELAKKIAYLPQIHTSPDDIDIRTLVSYGRYPYKKFGGGLTEEDNRIIDETLELTGLSHLSNRLMNNLSGGEKQKLALARALYKNAPVIVLDEPTAALDALAEYELYQNFDKMIQDKSAVYISHRLSSTRFCDVIAMFVAGEMVEYGTHEELLMKNGSYAEIFRVQAQYYEEQEGGADER